MKEYFERCLVAEYRQEKGGASWAIEERDGEVCILFEKSNGAEDWANNLHFHAVPYRGMRPVWQCHAGFLKVWRSVEEKVAEALREAMERGMPKRITVVGYSHGAALAVLCHEWIWYRYPAHRAHLWGYGFGCPRVLYGCLPPPIAQRWERFFVVRNLDDLVTHLPPRVMGYCHVGNLVEIGERDRYSSVEAHRPESYLAELERARPQIGEDGRLKSAPF